MFNPTKPSFFLVKILCLLVKSHETSIFPSERPMFIAQIPWNQHSSSFFLVNIMKPMFFPGEILHFRRIPPGSTQLHREGRLHRERRHRERDRAAHGPHPGGCGQECQARPNILLREYLWLYGMLYIYIYIISGNIVNYCSYRCS